MTDRMRLFVKYYIDSFNATDAAKKARYSPKTAYSMGQRLLKNVEVQKYKEELINKELGTGKDELQYRILKRLNAISFADIADDIKVVTKFKEVPELDEAGNATGEIIKYPYQAVEIIDTEKSNNTLAIASIKENDKGVIEVKYHDPVKAMEMLGKHIGFIEDKLSIDINENPKTREEIQDRIRELQEKNKK